MDIPIIYNIDAMTFKPKDGFGCIYMYEVCGKKYSETRKKAKTK